MALTKKQIEREATPPEHHWVCEGCEIATMSVNAPDTCDCCGHEYFSNLADDLRELASKRMTHH